VAVDTDEPKLALAAAPPVMLAEQALAALPQKVVNAFVRERTWAMNIGTATDLPKCVPNWLSQLPGDRSLSDEQVGQFLRLFMREFLGERFFPLEEEWLELFDMALVRLQRAERSFRPAHRHWLFILMFGQPEGAVRSNGAEGSRPDRET
jgi:hypothetical protein